MTKPFFYSYKNLLNGEVSMNSNFSNALYEIGTGFYFYDFPNGELGCFTMPELLVDTSEENQSGSIITLTEKTVKAIIYYCNAGTEYAEGGDGSKDHPWASVNYALGQLQRHLTCLRKFCNEYIVLKCSGVCDYPVRPIKKNDSGEWENFELYCWGKLIIYNLSININISKEIMKDTVTVIEFSGISNAGGASFIDCDVEFSCEINWKNFRDNVSPIGGLHVYGLEINGAPYITNCSVIMSIKSNGDPTQYTDVRAFSLNGSTKFINCTCNIVSSTTTGNPEARAYGFWGSSDSIVYNCTSSVRAITFIDGDYGNKQTAEAHGFSGISGDSIFSNCKGSGIATCNRDLGDNFYGESFAAGYGFKGCGKIFEKCEGVGEANLIEVKDDYTRKAAGFYDSDSDSQFFECTTSEPVCEVKVSSVVSDCAEFSPDI